MLRPAAAFSASDAFACLTLHLCSAVILIWRFFSLPQSSFHFLETKINSIPSVTGGVIPGTSIS